MIRLIDLPFAEACRVLDKWEKALHRASLLNQPWPSLDEERFRTPPNSSLARESEGYRSGSGN